VSDHVQDEIRPEPEAAPAEYEAPRAEDVSEDESVATASLVAS